MATDEAGKASERITFFLKYTDSVKKVKKLVNGMEDLYTAMNEKFPDVKFKKAEITFHTKDKKYGVEIAIDGVDELYDGAIVEIRKKGGGNSNSLKRQLEEMKSKLEHLENTNKRQRIVPVAGGAPPPVPAPNRVPSYPPIQQATSEHMEEPLAVRMRGLPWGYKKEDIINFFPGLRMEAILAILDKYGRVSGECYVVFTDEKDVEAAKAKHKEKIGERYIEVYRVVNPHELAMARRSTRNLLGGGETEVVLRLRGLPWQCTEKMVEEFFDPLKLGGVHLTHDRSGKFKGECLVRFLTAADCNEGLKKHKQSIGHRYIEIYRSSLGEWDQQTGAISGGPGGGITFVARMRGLPFTAGETDVREFFSGHRILRVHFPTDSNGRPSGECFVEVATSDELGRVLQKNRERMGHRYVEIFRSNIEEMHQVLGTEPAGRGGPPSAAQKYVGETFCIKMRGLPFQSTEQMITDFFQKANVTPIRIHRKNNGGEGFVEFTTSQEQQSALRLHKEHMGRRYIELFPVAYEEVAKIVGLPLDPYSDPSASAYPGYDYRANTADPYAAYHDYYANYAAHAAAYDPKAQPGAAGYDAKATEAYYAAYYGQGSAASAPGAAPVAPGSAGGPPAARYLREMP